MVGTWKQIPVEFSQQIFGSSQTWLFQAWLFAMFMGNVFLHLRLRSFALICVFLRPTAFRTTAFGNCRICASRTNLQFPTRQPCGWAFWLRWQRPRSFNWATLHASRQNWTLRKSFWGMQRLQNRSLVGEWMTRLKSTHQVCRFSQAFPWTRSQADHCPQKYFKLLFGASIQFNTATGPWFLILSLDVLLNFPGSWSWSRELIIEDAFVTRCKAKGLGLLICTFPSWRRCSQTIQLPWSWLGGLSQASNAYQNSVLKPHKLTPACHQPLPPTPFAPLILWAWSGGGYF